jgi:hypothetical protein
VWTDENHSAVVLEANARFHADILSALGTALLHNLLEDATQGQVLV